MNQTNEIVQDMTMVFQYRKRYALLQLISLVSVTGLVYMFQYRKR